MAFRGTIEGAAIDLIYWVDGVDGIIGGNFIPSFKASLSYLLSSSLK